MLFALFSMLRTTAGRAKSHQITTCQPIRPSIRHDSPKQQTKFKPPKIATIIKHDIPKRSGVSREEKRIEKALLLPQEADTVTQR